MSEKCEMSGTKCNKDGWVKKKLGEVCSSELGKTLNKSKDTGELYPYLCAVNILWDKIDLSNLKETKFKSSEIDRYTVKKGDLLICEGGDIGRSAIWNKDETILFQNALHRVRFNDEMNPRFCLLYLFYLKKKGVLDHTYGKGVTIKHLVKSALLSIPILVAPLLEQQHIVSELDCLNEIIEKQKEQLKQLDELAQSIFYDMFGNPVENEKGWKITSFNLGLKLSSGTSLSAKNIIPGEFPVYGGNGIVGYHNSFNLDGLNIIIGRVGALCGNVRCVRGKSFVTDNAFIVKKLIEGNETFLLYLLELLNLRKYAREAMQPVISNTTLKDIPIICPPVDLQQAFAQKIEAVEHQKELIKQSLAETENLFNSRMDYYFT